MFEAVYELLDNGIEISLGLFKTKKEAKKAIKKRAKKLKVKNHTYSFEGWVVKK